MIILEGILLGLAYVVPIGTQNIYVIKTALVREFSFSYLTAVIVIFMDISLGLSCIFGIGYIINSFSILKIIILFIGSAYLIWMGYSLLNSSVADISNDTNAKIKLIHVVRDAFVVTWLNPQAILDGSILFGSYRASLSPYVLHQFIIGICIASTCWFLFLTTIVGTTKHIMPKWVFSVINRICGLALIFFGIKLGYVLIKNLI